MILVVGAGAALRFFHLGSSFRVDELDTWVYSQRALWDIVVDLGRLPHVLLLSRLAEALLGREEFFLRLPFALYGVLTLPLIFLTGRELFDDEVGLLAALLLAVSAYHIGYCQEPRYYAPFIFYSLSAFYCLLRLLRREDASEPAWWRVWLAVFLLSHLLNLSLHRMAAYPVALSAVLIAWDIVSRRSRGNVPATARDWVPLLSLMLMLAFIAASQGRWLLSELSGAVTLRASYLAWHYREPRASVAWELLGVYSGGRQAAFILLAAGAAGLFVRGREGWRRAAPLLLWIVFPLVSLAVFRTRTHFELRYFLFLLPAWLLWAAAGLSAASSFLGARLSRGEGARRWVLLVMVAAVLACAAPSLAGYYRLPKARMREAFDHVSASCSDGDAVVMYPAWNTLWDGYYRLREGCRLLHPASLLEGSPAFAPEAVVGAPRRVWLAATWIHDPVRAKEFKRLRGLLSRRCEPEGERLFRSLNPSDDYRVSSFRCLGAGAPLRSAPPPTASRDLRPSFRGWGVRYRLLANIPQAAGWIQGRWRFSEDLSLSSGRMGLVDAGPRDKVLFVWSGAGTLAGSGGVERFSPGDVYFLPAGAARRWTSGSPSGATLLEIVLPGDAAGAGTAVRRLGNALDAGLVKSETVLLRGRRWRLSVCRMMPGARQKLPQIYLSPYACTLSVLIRGRLMRHWRGGGIDKIFPGDLFVASGRIQPPVFPILEELTELRLIVKGWHWLLPAAPMNFPNNDKEIVGYLPPMLTP